MEGAEDRTVSHLKAVRADVWQSAIEAAGGRIVNIVADSVLAEFGSAVAAVAAAFDIQERMARFNDGLEEPQRLMFRIGLHLGEVIVDETETIYGDAVNVAARIQLMAEPGGIAASQAMRDATQLQVSYAFVDGGKHYVKNVGRALQIYHVRTRRGASGALFRARRRASPTVTIRRPMLWATFATATVLLAAGSYLAFNADRMTAVRTAAFTFSADQLELALAERRKADALVEEKRRLQEEARRATESEAAARRHTDMELESARQARQQAERDLAQVKADIDARRQADVGKREQLTVSAQRAAEESARHTAEAATVALRDVQAKSAKKALPDVAARPVAAMSTKTATVPDAPPSSADGLWRGTYECGRNSNYMPFTLEPEIHLKDGVGTWYTVPRSSANNTVGITVSVDGTHVHVSRQAVPSGGASMIGVSATIPPLAGWIEGNSIRASSRGCTMVLMRATAAIRSTPRTAGL